MLNRVLCFVQSRRKWRKQFNGKAFLDLSDSLLSCASADENWLSDFGGISACNSPIRTCISVCKTAILVNRKSKNRNSNCNSEDHAKNGKVYSVMFALRIKL